MNHNLDEAIRSVLSDITATAPAPEDVPLHPPVIGRTKSRWLLPAVAAAAITVVGGLVVLASGDDSTSPASVASVSPDTSVVSDADDATEVEGTPATAGTEASVPVSVEESLPAVYGTYPGVAAVVAERADPSATLVTIDHGSSAGIEVGMAVVSAEGFVGAISAVSETSSEVRLIADPESSIECAAADGTVFACLGSGGDSTIEISPAMLDELQRVAGLDVVTVGSDSSFVPDGLPVGRLSEERLGFVEPAADLSELAEVFVIRYVPTVDDSAEGDTDENVDEGP